MNNPIAWLWLTLAVISEVIATTSLKASKELTVFWPSVLIVIGYMLASYFAILTMRHFPAILGLALIICGVILITIFSKMKAS